MKPRDLVRETTLSLTSNKVRSSLTVLGIVVGIASVIIMVALGQGTQASIMSSVSSMGANLLIVSPGSGTLGAQSGSTKTLTLDDATAIASLPDIAAMAPQVSSSGVVVGLNGSERVSVTGTNVSFPSIRSIETAYGAWFSDSQNAEAAKVAVIGPTTSDTLFGSGSNPVDQRIRINGESFTIIGVTKPKGSSGFGNADDVVYIPISTMQRYLSGGGAVSMVYVEATSQAAMPTAKAAINDLLLQRHGIAAGSKPDFSVTSQQDLATTVSTITNLMTLLLGAIAGISLLVGGIGIMNMMLTTVTERIQEIGLRKALGAKRIDVTSQFLAESVALTVMGGLIGLSLGWGVSTAVASLTTFQTQVSWSSAALAVSVSTGIGIVFGWYPARRAAKLNAIDALRYQ
jgi:putative ABC transport system permease protein